MDVQARVVTCVKSRQAAAKATRDVLASFTSGTEVDLRNQLQKAVATQPDLLPQGWYCPPPSGIGVLFGSSNDASRTNFASLRQKQYWPSSSHSLDAETVGVIYLSPIHKNGTIADLGFSFYGGKSQKIKDHLKLCLESLEEIATHAAVGMKFCDLHKFGEELFAKRKLDNQKIVATHSPPGSNLGHTVPWSYELPTAREAAIIENGKTSDLNDTVSHKRLYLTAAETLVIPDTIAFTVESQLGSSDSSLPNVFFHLIVTFKNGKKQVLSNFNPIFDKLGIDYMRSRF